MVRTSKVISPPEIVDDSTTINDNFCLPTFNQIKVLTDVTLMNHDFARFKSFGFQGICNLGFFPRIQAGEEGNR